MSFFCASDDFVDEAVSFSFVSAHDVVAVGIFFDTFEGLPRVSGEDIVEDGAHAHDFFSLQVDIRGLSGDTAGDEWLVNEDAAVRQGVTFSLCASAEEYGAHASGLTDADRGDGAPDMLDGIVDGHTSGDTSARRVNIDLDIFFGIFAFEEEELSNDAVSDHICDGTAQNDYAVFEQAAEDIPGAFASMRLFDYCREKSHFFFIVLRVLHETELENVIDFRDRHRISDF